jgi:hypothetical protein
MIDFQNGPVFKLKPADAAEIGPDVAPVLLPSEEILAAFKAIPDFVVFTDKKRDFSSLPYSKIQAFSVETAGTFDLDAELELWFSGLGKVRLEFKGAADIAAIGRMIAVKVL